MKNNRQSNAARPIPRRILAALICLLLLALPLQAGSAPEKQVDLNSATQAELMEIPGIGEVMAERIVAFRDEHGPFERVEDLMKVKGIGEKSFQKLSAHVKVSRPKDKK